MTVVIGINSLTEAIMIADTRVSWENEQHPPQDILRKLYTLGDSNKSMVLGFSGDVQAASIVMRSLMEHKLKEYKRPLVLSQFKDELGRWIEEIANKELPTEKRTKITFMLGGIEPSRHPPILKDGQVMKSTSLVEIHIYVYRINSKGKVYYDSKSKGYDVIGTGRGAKKEVTKKVQEAISFGINHPQLHWARAVVMGEAVAGCIKENEEVSKTVGGPFQVIRITPNGLETHYIWPPGEGDRNVEVQRDGSKTVIYNPSTEGKYVLYSIWDLPSWLVGEMCVAHH